MDSEESEEDLEKEYKKIYANPKLLVDSDDEEENNSHTFAAAEDYSEEIDKVLQAYSRMDVDVPLKKQKQK